MWRRSFLLLIGLLVFGLYQAQAQSPYLLLAEARDQYAQGHLDTALIICNRLLSLSLEDPVLEEALFLKGYILADKGEGDKAWKILEEAIGKFPDSHHLPQAYFYLARIAEERGDWSAALGYLRLIRKHYPQSPTAPKAALLEVRLLLQKKRYQVAEDLLKWIIRRAEDLPKIKAQAAVKLLALYHQLGREGEVARLLQQIPGLDELYSYAPDILYWQGYLAYKNGQNKEAQVLWLKYVNLAPKSPRIRDVFYLLAEMAREDKDIIKARQFYAYIAATWPASKEAIFSKFRLFELKKNFYAYFGGPTPQEIGTILPVLSMICQRWSDDPIVYDVWPIRIELTLKQKGPEPALKLSWEFLSHYHQSPRMEETIFWIRRSLEAYDRLLYSKKNYLGLVNYHWIHLSHINKLGSPEHWYFLGEAYRGLDLFEQARRAYAQAWELKPGPTLAPDIMAAWAEALMISGELEASRLLIEELLKANPRYQGSPAILSLRGRLALRTKDYARAREFLSLAIERSAEAEEKLRLWPLWVEAIIGTADFRAAKELLASPPKGLPSEQLLFLLKEAGQRGLAAEEVAFALEIYEMALERYPEDPELLWYQALSFERLGQEAAAEEIWQRLSQTESQPYQRLAQAMLKARDLVDRARGEIF
ncbi:tetratricopeptide repeat protein [Thermosulfuriphilus sp.]